MTRRTREFPIYINSLGRMLNVRAVNLLAALEQAKLIEKAGQKLIKDIKKDDK